MFPRILERWHRVLADDALSLSLEDGLPFEQEVTAGGGFHFLSALISKGRFIFTSSQSNTDWGSYEVCCRGRRTDIYCNIPWFTFSYSLLLSRLIRFLFDTSHPVKLYFWIKGHFRLLKEMQKSTSPQAWYVLLYSPCLSLINLSHRFFPSTWGPFFHLQNSSQHWWMYQAQTTFDFGLLILSASPNIHFGCSAPSHWFLRRWNSDWTDLSPPQTCVLHHYDAWRRTPTHPITWQANYMRPVTRYTLKSPIFKLKLVLSLSSSWTLTLRCQDEGYRKVVCN